MGIIWFLIKIVIIVVGFIVVMSAIICPFIYFFFYIIDIFFGNSYFKFIRSNKFKYIMRSIRKYRNLNRFLRLFKNSPRHKKELYLRYNTPAYSFCCSLVIIGILMQLLISKFNDLEAFILSNTIYILCYYIGMYRKLYDKADDKKFMAAIETNQEFLKLSFIPITFIVTIIGFTLGVMGWVNEFDGFSVNIHKASDSFELFLQKITYENSFKSILYDIFEILVFMYIFSLPLQAIGYFGIQIILYIKKHGTPYLIFIKNIIKSIKTSIKT